MSLTLSFYSQCLGAYPLAQALDIAKGMGLNGAEVNVGGFVPSPHAHVDLLLSSKAAREDYLGIFAEKGMKLAGLNANGNPLSPLPDVGPKHDYDLKRAIKLAGLLGVGEVVTMSGAPGSDSEAKYPSWVINPWDGVYGEILEYQESVVDKYWIEVDKRAGDAGVKIAWELHPHNTIFTPHNFMRFLKRTGGKHIGVNMDPSHLMWQHMDILECLDFLGKHILHVHAKDTKIEKGCATKGVLDTEFVHWPENEDERYPSAMNHWCQVWPENPAWRFVYVGGGHDLDFWTIFCQKISKINSDMNVSIEHEDVKYGTVEGLEMSAKTLVEAAKGL
ncbi:sugar phosphate isomerase/epimerase family protein [Mobiluncus mulieris]|uniref:sugar phosphate isomerase/epimerase family protein n=1 Tax=Mobiluncus mulieris TaxID=2052 RepID=UPI0014700D51|nr:sugar phosphate isomerase/epimerase [Mobiluncus mulieris]MCU9970595.1 sugar phosphate isomerase/epimerase [Mobiluncus mulieris]NMW90573.1 sugar phosphate isomerase/epimerase [Mobiluncus mulieris]